MARFRLRLRTTEINLPLGEVLIGRGPECYLRVNEPMVSRRHARLRVGADRVMLEDLGSRNGSQVNGVSVVESVLLTPGDMITIGTQQFTLESEDDPGRRRPTGAHPVPGPGPSSGPAGPGMGSPAGPGMGTGPDRPRSHPNMANVASVNIPVAVGSAMSGPTLTAPAVSSRGDPVSGPGAGPTGPGPMPASRNSGVSGPYTPPGPHSQDEAVVVPLPPSGLVPSLGHCGNCGAPAGDGPSCPRCGQPYRSDFEGPATTTGRGSSYHLFWGLSDKVLAMGRVDEAERMMGPRLQEMLSRAEGGDLPDEAIISDTLRRGLRLAAATRRDEWFGWMFDYARVCRYRMTLGFLDEIYAQMFACRPMVGPQILGYAQILEEEALILRLVTLRRLCRE